MLWILLIVCLAIAVIFAVLPFFRTAPLTDDVDRRTRLYQQQIKEIDKEESLEVISSSEASALRIEAQRRLLDASSQFQTQEKKMPLSRTSTALAIAGMVVVGGISMYSFLGRPNVPSSDPTDLVSDINEFLANNTSSPGTPKMDGVEIMMRKLADRLEREPNDVEGWRMLGWSYFSQEQYEKAAKAYAKAVALAPNEADYLSAYGEAVVRAAGGFVTDEAIVIFDKTIKLNPGDARARFFKGLKLDQARDPEAAITTWITMINQAPANAEWVPDLRSRIAKRAAETGIDIKGRIKSVDTQRPSTPSPNPTQAQIKAAMEMPANDRQAMIEGMVAGLAARLKDNPNDPEGWIKLIRSRKVLGQQAQAQRDLKTALKVFSNSPNIKKQILSEADRLGISLP